MREVQVRAAVTDPWDSPMRQILVSWRDDTGQTFGARVYLEEGIPEPVPAAPPPPAPDPIKVRFPALTDEDVAWVRQQQQVTDA
jgi:hypothetical protein